MNKQVNVNFFSITWTTDDVMELARENSKFMTRSWCIRVIDQINDDLESGIIDWKNGINKDIVMLYVSMIRAEVGSVWK